MTDSLQANTQIQTEKPQVTSQLGRGRLEQALNRALEAGPEAIAQQLRYILAISQMTALQPKQQTYTTSPLSIGAARLQALVAFAQALNQTQLKSLIREIQQIDDDYTRLSLIIDVIPRIPSERQLRFIKAIWRQLMQITDATTRAHILLKLAPLIEGVDETPVASSSLMQIIQLAQDISDREARLRSPIALATYLPSPICVKLQHRILDELDESNNDTLRCNMLSTLSKHLAKEVLVRALQCAEGIDKASERARALTALAANLSEELRPRLRIEALKAIQTIQSEDERTEALIAFAPHLEYATENQQFPEILEQTLAIAIAINRRSLRARVLVALAPHLTSDLQGEALAAVHTLDNEHDRAMLLAELAPTLPANMLVASLAVAHTMREQDARAHALTVLARYAPKLAQEQTRLDALAAASNLPHYFERVTALMNLVDILPETLQEQAYSNAIETTKQIENENARARAIGIVGSRLPASKLSQLVEIAKTFEDPQLRLNALSTIATRLPSEQQNGIYRELLKCVKALPYAYKQARSLISILPLLPEELLEEAQYIADNMRDPLDRVNIYLTLSQNLAPEKRKTVLAKAWQLIPLIDDGYDRATMLAAIAPLLPEKSRQDLSKVIWSVLTTIRDDYDRASAIGLLAPLLTDNNHPAEMILPAYQDLLDDILETAFDIEDQSKRADILKRGVRLYLAQDKTAQYRIWRRLAQRLKTLPLSDVLSCLSVLQPLIVQIAGENAMRDVVLILGVR